MPRDCTKACQEGYNSHLATPKYLNPYPNTTIDWAAFNIGKFIRLKTDWECPDKCVKSRGNTYIVSLCDETLKYSCDRWAIVERKFE